MGEDGNNRGSKGRDLYKLVTQYSLESLEFDVNKLLGEGWELYGQPDLNKKYVQPMVKYYIEMTENDENIMHDIKDDEERGHDE